MPQAKFSTTNCIILIALVFFGVNLFTSVELFQFGMNRTFFDAGIYHIWLAQFFISQLLHGSAMHFLFNALFLYYFWNTLEKLYWSRFLLAFFVFCAVWLGLLITFLSSWNTVWMSWFVLWVLSFYTLDLYKRDDPEYKWWVTAIIINIAIWLAPGISFIGHAGWVMLWIFFYFIYKKIRT